VKKDLRRLHTQYYRGVVVVDVCSTLGCKAHF
jgi:hypothetical protein